MSDFSLLCCRHTFWRDFHHNESCWHDRKVHYSSLRLITTAVALPGPPSLRMHGETSTEENSFSFSLAWKDALQLNHVAKRVKRRSRSGILSLLPAAHCIVPEGFQNRWGYIEEEPCVRSKCLWLLLLLVQHLRNRYCKSNGKKKRAKAKKEEESCRTWISIKWSQTKDAPRAVYPSEENC